jgi:uncharacterized protein (TIGR02246 family)
VKQGTDRLTVRGVLILGLVAAVTVSGLASAQSSTPADAGTIQSNHKLKGNDTMTIEHVLQRYEAALNANDLDTILGLYGAEPVFMPQHAPALEGRAAVRAGYQQVFESIKLNVRFDVHEIHEQGDWAWARTSSAGTTRILATGAQVTEGNNELFIFHREQGDWKIHRYLFATNQPKS